MTDVVIDQAVAHFRGLLVALRDDDARGVARHSVGLVQALWRFAREGAGQERRAA